MLYSCTHLATVSVKGLKGSWQQHWKIVVDDLSCTSTETEPVNTAQSWSEDLSLAASGFVQCSTTDKSFISYQQHRKGQQQKLLWQKSNLAGDVGSKMVYKLLYGVVQNRKRPCGIVLISVKWTKWMAEITFSLDCVSVSVCSKPVGALNANSS